MDFFTLVTELAQQSKYTLLFIVYLLEGPVAGFISAFIATTGQLDISIAFPLLILAEIIADLFFYYLGRRLSNGGLNKKVKKYEQNNLLRVIKEILLTHPIRALIAIKVISVIAIPGLILIGKYKSLKVQTYLLWVSIICLIKNSVVSLMGYGLGIGVGDFLAIYDIYMRVVIVAGVVVVGYVLVRAYQDKIEKGLLTVLRKMK
ncbi:hypothetical protein K8R14_03190 [bacterium]|nr:hypothetical protein [bacterium]